VVAPLAFAHSPLPDVAPEWEALADATGAGPFVRPGWFEAWASAFAEEPVSALTARRDGRLVGALALLSRRSGLVSPTNWHTPAYAAVAAGDDVAAALAQEALRSAPHRLDLSFLDPADGFARAVVDASREASRRLIVRPVLRSPYLALEGDFESYEASRPSKVRREIARRRKRLEELGAVEVSFVDGGENLERLLAEGFAVEGSGWKTERGTAIAEDRAAARFYRDVAAWAAAAGWLQLGFVRVGGRAVAFSYSLVVGDTCHVVKVGFDPEFGRYAVGKLLTREAIRRAFEQGLAVYDFLGGEDRYKLEWTEAVRERTRVQAFGRTPAGTASFLAWRYGRPALKRAGAALRSRR
jgi:CelD/BcsL family acetyltransferase involved in cellulose biosynthesis